jgi:hypothetical protein
MLQKSQWYKHRRTRNVPDEEVKDSTAFDNAEVATSPVVAAVAAATTTVTSAVAAIARIHYDGLDTVSTSEEPGPAYVSESDAGSYMLDDWVAEEDAEYFDSDSEFDSETDDAPVFGPKYISLALECSNPFRVMPPSFPRLHHLILSFICSGQLLDVFV